MSIAPYVPGPNRALRRPIPVFNSRKLPQDRAKVRQTGELMAPAYDNNNIFAKILRGEAPCTRVYEDETALAFMDIMPRSDGHVLVIPKTPARNVLDMPAQEFARFMPAVQKIAIAVKAAMAADGVSIMQFNEAASGQVVFHLHFHILPRWEGVPSAPAARRDREKRSPQRQCGQDRGGFGAALTLCAFGKPERSRAQITCGSIGGVSPDGSSSLSTPESPSPRRRGLALRTSGSSVARLRPATSRSRSRRGCAGPSG